MNEMIKAYQEINKRKQSDDMDVNSLTMFAEAWNHQQAKIDELQKLRSIDEVAINQLAQANQVWQIKCDELQGRIDEALRHVIDHGGYDDLTHVINILKGNKDELQAITLVE